ncbi:MAG: protein kinase, partial [archaeon]|nr:protein kinase [archaeon]
MLMPLCSRGSLYDEIVNRYPTKQYFTDRGVLKIFEEVCHGVAVLHSKRPRPIIHRDLKVENVLFDEHLQAQVCDFGSATDRYISPSSMRKDLIEEEIQAATTLVYRAPECIEFFSEYLITEKMDIWALGCLLFKTMYFEDAFAEGALAIVNVKPATPPAVRQFSRALQELYAWLWTENPSERPDIFQVIVRVSELRGNPVTYDSLRERYWRLHTGGRGTVEEYYRSIDSSDIAASKNTAFSAGPAAKSALSLGLFDSSSSSSTTTSSSSSSSYRPTQPASTLSTLSSSNFSAIQEQQPTVDFFSASPAPLSTTP